ncbi:unnamed protein product [Sphagnum balticum]
MIEICAELKRLSGLMYDVEYVPYILNLCYMMWKKKKKCFICVTMARNWLLNLGSSTQLLSVFVIYYIKFILFVACLVVFLYHQS